MADLHGQSGPIISVQIMYYTVIHDFKYQYGHRLILPLYSFALNDYIILRDSYVY